MNDRPFCDQPPLPDRRDTLDRLIVFDNYPARPLAMDRSGQHSYSWLIKRYDEAKMAIDLIEDASDGDIAAWLHDRLGKALGAVTGEIAITVPGGSTPFPILAELAKSDLDFTRIAVWPGDDRVVAEDHPASNVGRIRRLLEPPGARIVPLQTGAVPPHFALAWLGMGGDGHIASLFPNTDPRVDDPLPIRRLTPDPLPPEAPFDRISLTIPALIDSDQLLFVIRGTEKRAVFDAAANGASDLPIARLLNAAHRPVTCFN